MTSKSTKILMGFAFAFGLFTLCASVVFYLIVFCVIPLFREFSYYNFNGVLDLIDWSAILCNVLLFICYFIPFLVTLCSKNRRVCFVVSLIMLIIIFVYKVANLVIISPLIQNFANGRLYSNLTDYYYTKTMHNFVVFPFQTLAFMFFCVAFGTLCIKKD